MAFMWAFLPLKDFVQAKQRLAGSLTVSERRGLFHAMVEDVLTVMARYSGFKRVVLLSDDPAAQLLAEHYGVDCWSERAFGVEGLNAVVTAALAKMLEIEGRDCCSAMIVHGDLPLLSQAELDELFVRHRQLTVKQNNGVSIATDSHQCGSNIVVCHPAQAPTLAYGPTSCADHYRDSERLGLPVQVLKLPGIAQDIDTREDLLALIAMALPGSAKFTLKFLQEAGIDQRLQHMSSVANTEANIPNKKSAGTERKVL